MDLGKVARATVVLLALAQGAASAATVVKIAVPGAKTMMFGSLNTQGAVIGSDRYGSHRKDWEAFIRTPDGAITTFRYPGAVATFGLDMDAAGIAIGTFFVRDDKVQHAYLRAADGSLTEFVLSPGVVANLYPVAINNAGTIAGGYAFTDFGPTFGFVRAPDGTVTEFAPSGSTGTAVRGMNKDGVIVGDFNDASNVSHGFVRAPDGTITQIDAPASDMTGTQIDAINANGEVTGSYRQDGQERYGHAFFRDAAGNFTFFSAGSGDTLPTSIDNDREITGVFFSNDGSTRGFVYKVGGGVTTFKIGAAGSHKVFPYRIINGGTVAGAVQVTGTKNYGFLRIP